jgi:hypothetical protein
MKLKPDNRKNLFLIAAGAAVGAAVSPTGTLQAVTTVQVGSLISGRIVALKADDDFLTTLLRQFVRALETGYSGDEICCDRPYPPSRAI